MKYVNQLFTPTSPIRKFWLRAGTLRVPRALSLSGSLNRFKGTSGLFYFKILN